MVTGYLAGFEPAMREALAEAARCGADVPVGAVVLDQAGQIIGRGHNQRESGADPTAHAEMLLLREAAQRFGAWRLGDATLYVTKEPCLMCAGAMIAARIKRLVYGARDPKNLTLEAVIDGALATTGTAPRGAGLVQAVQRAVYVRTVEALLTLAADKSTASEVRAVTQAKLVEIRRRADSRSATDAYLAHRIDLYLSDPAKFAPAEPIEAPPGMPIGEDE